MHANAYYLVNGITLYRLLAAPVLILLLFTGNQEIFRWMLVLSFTTDAIDGWLARKFKVVSNFGAKLDSIGDDLTVLAGTIGVLVFDPLFFWSRWLPVSFLLILFTTQVTLAIIRYGKFTSFHTYLAKVAAVAQGLFFIAFFFLPSGAWLLFNLAFIVTSLDLVEEIILVIKLPEWHANVKGLFWVNRLKRR